MNYTKYPVINLVIRTAKEGSRFTMNSITTQNELPTLAIVRLARATVVLIFAFLSMSVETQGQEAPSVRSFPNAPGWITVVWEHSEKDIYGFVVERQGPPYEQKDIVGVAVLNSPTRQFTDMFLNAATAYNHRVCAVYDDHRTCSDWVRTSTLPPPSPGGSGGGASSPPTQPKYELRTPVLTATSNHPLMITLHWGSDSVDNYTLGNVQLYRDGQITFDAKKYGGFTAAYTDNGKMIDSGNATGQALRPNTEYTYKVCFIGFGDAEGQTKCSNEITAMGNPLAPSAPIDVRVAALPLSGRAARGGAVMLRPKPKVSVTWRNTDVPGQFITIEALDTLAPGDIIAGGAIQTAPGQRWIEATRVNAKDDPTALTIDRPVSLITTNAGLTTYRVCAVVPKLGDAGKACSQPVSLP